jgi:N-acetylneuraminic acid mutarotase
MMMKWLFKLCIISLVFLGTACKKTKDEDPKEWTNGSNFEGVPRSAAASFMINGMVYVTTGYNGEKRLKDLWYYDCAKRNWYSLKDADFPGKERNAAVAFVINGRGYVGGGYDGNISLNDYYEFNPETKTWKPIAVFPGEARNSAVAFSGNGKGFVGCGTSEIGDLKDFYSYDPLSNVWEKVTSIPGAKRTNPFTFTINGTVYIGGGKNNGAYLSDFYKFDPKSTDPWKQLKDLSRNDEYKYAIGREMAATFVLGNKGYIVGGNSGSVLGSTWAYDPGIDVWKECQALGGTAREAAVGFSYNGKGYITTGRNGALRFDDTWVFTPNN